MAIPTYQVFMKPILEFLVDGKEHTTGEIGAVISASSQFNFTSDELEQKNPSGRQGVIAGRIGWAKTYLGAAGLIVQPRRAICVITKRGLEALSSGAVIDTQF